MLRIENLFVEYERRGEKVPAVQGLSLSMNEGDSLGLVGESGSGKSTVALAILRLIRPAEGRVTGGRILFEDQDLLSLSNEAMRGVRGKRIAMIFQDPFTSLNPVLRIRLQMEELLLAHQLPCDPRRLQEALEQVQLDPGRVLDAYPHQLSGGQRQRVMIAIALLARPRLLLADEPTTALDVLVQKEVLDLLFGLQKSLGMAMLFISHNLALVAQRTARLAVLSKGLLVESGLTAEIARSPSHPYVKQLLAAVLRLEARR
jgi:ABC-type dipeptide/oligopeptide/nickel transport system ATPase component